MFSVRVATPAFYTLLWSKNVNADLDIQGELRSVFICIIIYLVIITAFKTGGLSFLGQLNTLIASVLKHVMPIQRLSVLSLVDFCYFLDEAGFKKIERRLNMVYSPRCYCQT